MVDAVFRVEVVQGFIEPPFQPDAGGVPFREDDEAAVVPGASLGHVGADPVGQPLGSGILAASMGLRDGEHGIDRREIGRSFVLRRVKFRQGGGRGGRGVFVWLDGIVVLTGRLDQVHRECRGRGQVPHEAVSVLGERSGECLDRGEKALLEAHEDQSGLHGTLWASFRCSGEQGCAVRRQHAGENQFRTVRGEVVDHHGGDHPLREWFAEVAEIGFQATHHDGFEIARPHLHPPGEPLWVEHLEQRREGIGMAVVRGGREKEAMLEAGCQRAHRLGKLAVDGVACAVGWRGMVGLIKDQQRARTELTEQVP